VISVFLTDKVWDSRRGDARDTGHTFPKRLSQRPLPDDGNEEDELDYDQSAGVVEDECGNSVFLFFVVPVTATTVIILLLSPNGSQDENDKMKQKESKVENRQNEESEPWLVAFLVSLDGDDCRVEDKHI